GDGARERSLPGDGGPDPVRARGQDAGVRLMPTVAEHLAHRLHEAGVRHAFGIPGGEVLAVMDALARAGIAFHLVKHETPGGFMADAVAHLTRTPGVLVATLGPGVSNLVTAVAHAYLDRTPMLVLTARIDPGVAPTYTHQIFDHGALLRPVTKATFTVGRDGATALVDRAVLLATADPPGPVHLDIPVRVASMEVERARESLPRRRRAEGPPRPSHEARVRRGSQGGARAFVGARPGARGPDLARRDAGRGAHGDRGVAPSARGALGTARGDRDVPPRVPARDPGHGGHRRPPDPVEP